jgi:hypothetical protein
MAAMIERLTVASEYMRWVALPTQYDLISNELGHIMCAWSHDAFG